jgi:hypothetical protein
MKLIQIICLTVIAAGVGSAADVTNTTICDLVKRPQDYAGHMVKFAAERSRPPRGILVDDPGGKCGPILVELPADPDVHPRAHFNVVTDAELKRFLDATYVLIPNAKTHKKGTIRATLQGRLDVAPPGKGFGHGQLYDLRLVLQQVSGVAVYKDDESGGPSSSASSRSDSALAPGECFRQRMPATRSTT